MKIVKIKTKKIRIRKHLVVISKFGMGPVASTDKRLDTIYPRQSCPRWQYELQS